MINLELIQKEFAELVGVTPQAIRDFVKQGMPGVSKPVRNATYVDLRLALPWLSARWRGGASDDRARLRRIQADDAEADWLVKQGTLLEATKVREVWANECSAMRARLLSVPAVAAVKIGPEMTQAQRQEIIRREVCEALAILSGGEMALADVEDDEETKEEIPKGKTKRRKVPRKGRARA